jgi:DNA-binding SARP family transcriptional activator
MRFRILGPLEVWAEGTWQPITAEKWRSLLACLLVRAGEVVPTDALTYELWGNDPPAKAKNLISIYVLRLRRLLGDTDGMLAFRAPGYVLNIPDDDLDSAHFDSLVADGQRALADGDPVRAVARLSAGLGLWRGPFLADVPSTPLIEPYYQRAMELRLAATELWAAGCVACGRSGEVVPELRRLVGEQPLREGLWLQLMRALDGAGRHAEALEAYARAREVISEELGVDPGAELQRLYADLLATDAAAVAPDDGPVALAAPSGTGRPGRPVSEARPDADSREGERTTAIPVGDLPGRIMMGNYADLGALPGASAGPSAAQPPPVPAADTAVPRPTQLPTDIGDFTGRGAHIQQLCDMLTSGGPAGSPGAVPIAFVAGAGGLGKTTLAVHAAHQIRDQFPDGQLYVDLLGATPQPLPPGDVLARFLRDLGVPGDHVPAGDEERAALYRTRLTGRRVLIVLDNARDTAQVRPLLPGSALCAVLVTTRNRTADLASTRYVDLHVLSDDEALTLFTRILGDERPAAEADATAEVLLACAGLPLAIRICAARLAARSRWKIATMASRLRNEQRRLDELTTGDLAVRACFQVSYDSLRRSRHGSDPARVFRMLGLWQGPSISLHAAAALLGEPESDVQEALESLVDANLLESSDPDWYRFHDLLRFYATERAVAEDPEVERLAAVDRILRWYLATADAAASVNSPHRYQVPIDDHGDAQPFAFTTKEQALAWYDSERANLVAATRQASDQGIDKVGGRLPTALFTIFNRRSNWADCVTTHRMALVSARRAGSRLVEGWVLHNLGLALSQMRDKEGLRYLEEALAIRREIGDSAGQAQAAVNIAEAYYELEGPRVALKYMMECVEVVRGTGPPARYAVALNNLGEVYLELGRLDEAVACLAEVREVAAGVGEAYVEGHALHNLGRAYLDMGRMEAARDALRAAITTHRATGDQVGEAVALTFLGRAQHSLDQVADARASWLTALRIYESLGDKEQTAEIESLIASLPGLPDLAEIEVIRRMLAVWCFADYVHSIALGCGLRGRLWIPDRGRRDTRLAGGTRMGTSSAEEGSAKPDMVISEAKPDMVISEAKPDMVISEDEDGASDTEAAEDAAASE